MPITEPVTTPEMDYDQRQSVRELNDHERHYFYSVQDIEARIEQKYSQLEKEIQKQLED